jgi:hypothetical protein
LAKRIDCFYGQSGTGKSEAALRVAKLIYESMGKKTRVLVGDGSKATYTESGMVDAGIIETLDYTPRDWPTSTLQQLCEGYWPADAEDPKSLLIAPKHDGNAAEKAAFEALKSIGVYIIEGVSVGGLYIMGDTKGGLAYRAGKGEKIGQDSPIRYVDAEVDALGNAKAGTGPGYTFGGNPISHYGVGQKRLLGVIERSKVLPMEFVLWTAHERAAEDKISKEQLIGPEAAGGAMTGNLQRYFNNTLHFATAEKRTKGDKDDFTGKLVEDLDVEYRIWTRDHFSAQGNVTAKYKAVTRGVSAADMPHYFSDENPGDSIEKFYRTISEIRKKRAAAVLAAAPQTVAA